MTREAAVDAATRVSGARRPLPRLETAKRPAGLALLRWLEDASAPRLCLISGGPDAGGRPDSGATHLLAWLAQAGTDTPVPADQAVHAVLPAEGLTVDTAVWLLAEQLALPARTPAELVAAVRADGRRTVLCVAELDCAGGPALPGEPLRTVRELLDPLLACCPLVRLVVDVTDASAAAGFHAVAHPAVIDLGDPRWSFPAAGADDAPASPGERGDAAERWWRDVPPQARDALRVLVAAPRALSVDEWELLSADAGGAAAVAAARAVLPAPLGGRYRLDVARAAGVGEPGEGDLGPDPLVARERSAAVTRLAQAVPRRDGAPDFPAAGGGLLTLLLEYAVLAGRAAELLADPRFLVHADPKAVTTAFAAVGARPDQRMTVGTALPLARAWHEAGPGLVVNRQPEARATLLRARLLGRQTAAERQAAELLAPVCAAARWVPQWAHWTPRAVVGAGLRRDGSLLEAEATGTVHVVDARDGAEAGRLVRPQGPVPLRDLTVRADDGAVVLLDDYGTLHTLDDGRTPPAELGGGACVVAALPDSASVAVGDHDGSVRLGDRRAPLHAAPVTALAAARLPGVGHSLLLSGGADGTVRLWNPAGSDDAPSDPVDRHAGPVTAVALCATPAGTQLACAWADGLLRLRLLDEDSTVTDLRLGSPVWALTPEPTGALLLSLPDGRLRLGPPAAPPPRG